ncbi:MAG TPA: hypothetical protein VFH99_00770 [Candidatus Saccharimonadales bacterium]|nr:hypothetical protein [Candidatus Saccharimonadales bacterium]
MDRTWWHKQTPDQPLFPDLLWSRPENKRQAGKLLIIGGNAHGFAAPAEAFAAAGKAGAGTVRVVLPDSLQKTVGQSFPDGEYAPSTPSGSFSRQALDELLDIAKWADAVMLAGDFGHNSETAILLEKFAQDYTGRLVLVGDAIDYFISVAESILKRPDTLLVTDFAQLQKLAKKARWPQAFISGMDLLRLIDNLHNFTSQFRASVIIEHSDNTIVAVNEQVSTIKIKPSSLVSGAAAASVWWLQNPGKPFEAITTSRINKPA